MTEKTGRCLCGAVSFTVTDPATTFGGCHCSMCRQWTSGALLALTVPAETIRIEGAENITSYKSSDWAERCFCGTCGSTLWYRVTAEGPHQGTYHVGFGLFDDLSDLTLDSEIFIDEKPEGYSLAGDLKQMTGAEVMAMFSGEGG